MKTMQVGILWTALLGAAVAGGIAATNSRAPKKCASQPSDGGQCLMRRSDGGVVKFGVGTEFSAKAAFGECEIKTCAPEP